MDKCKVEDCEQQILAKGYCSRHYQQVDKKGAPFRSVRFEGNIFFERDGYIELVAIRNGKKHLGKIDKKDFLKVSAVHWGINGNHGQPGYFYNKKINFLLHRYILGMSPSDAGKVDHINRDKLDNRRANLRIVGHVINARNRSVSDKSESGQLGVLRDAKNSNNWVARISVSCKTKVRAIEIRRDMERRYWGKDR